jgi:hypothetical protein
MQRIFELIFYWCDFSNEAKWKKAEEKYATGVANILSSEFLT